MHGLRNFDNRLISLYLAFFYVSLMLCIFNDTYNRYVANCQSYRSFGKSSPGESVKEPGPFGFRKRDSHTGHERRMQHDRADLVSCSEIDCGHRADALPIEYYVLRTDAVTRTQRVPRGIDVRVEILLGRLATRYSVARVVVAEYVAVYSGAQPQVEARHLAEVDGVAVGKEDGEARGRRAPHEQACYAIAARRSRVEALHSLLLTLGVLPLGAFRQGDGILGALVLDERIRGLGRKEGQLVGDSGRAGRTAEQATQFTQT